MYKSEQTVSGDIEISPDGLHLESLIDWNDIDYPNSILLNCDNHVNLENQEDTMDASTKYSLMPMEYKPVSPIGPPERENFSGDLKFQIEISGADTNRSKFMYSHRLNRIFVSMGHGFSVQMKWDAEAQPYAAMFVRATPVFCDKAQAEKRVTKCIQHYYETTHEVPLSEAMRYSVLHSTRDVGTQDVFYCGGESPDVWYSVVVRFTAPSAHVYQFVCKNSCSSGINRRTIAIIFTLEDHTGKVYGRQSVGARACSCPKRDMQREESEEAPRGKRPPTAPGVPGVPGVPAPTDPPAPRSKKIKIEVRPDPERIEVITNALQVFEESVPVLDLTVVINGLNVMLNETERGRSAVPNNDPDAERYELCIAGLKKAINKLQEQIK